ncbi:MAG: HIT family protein [Chitinophagaceae bacterium]|nr:HIT family protein [Chitinophagaceae bacterium]
MGKSIFSKIIDGTIPCYKIAEDENFISFLDVFPLQKGHVLVIPKQQIDKCFDLSSDILSKWFLFAQPIAKAIEKSFDCNRCGVSIIGIEVPHAHMHLLPINNANDINFTNPKLKLEDQEFIEIQKRIISYL